MRSEFASCGISPEAVYVMEVTQSGFQHLRGSISFGFEAVRDELGAVWGECRFPDWDGYGALAVSQESLQSANFVIDTLPLGFPAPSVGAEPDGQLTLEWHQSPSKTISVSVDPDGLLHYAGLIGPNRRFGTEVFYGEFPEVIQRTIREICS